MGVATGGRPRFRSAAAKCARGVNVLAVIIINGETWAFTGGRTFADQAMFDDVMSRLLGMWGCPSRVVHGAARGLDAMADAWGKERGVTIERFHAKLDKKKLIVLSGHAKGADAQAEKWCWERRVSLEIYRADWDKHGKAAGPFRNEDILTKYKPRKLIAFPGGRGTADMVQRAKNRRGEIDVVEIKPTPLTSGVRRVRGCDYDPQGAREQCMQEAVEYVRGRPDTGPLSAWKFEWR